ncbi:MAG: flavoprotein [Chloroflexota bacterium]
MLAGKTVLVGVTGGVAVHYLPELIGQLRWRYLANVQAMMTPAATRFVTPLILKAASGNPVYADLWEAAERAPVIHVQLACLADLVLIAPATADILAKLAHGLADDLVTLTVLATRAPVVLAPAMHEEMWIKAVVQDNVARLQERGYHFVGPERGISTTGEVAEGRMANIGVIIAKLIDLAGELAGNEGEKKELAKDAHVRLSVSKLWPGI